LINTFPDHIPKSYIIYNNNIRHISAPRLLIKISLSNDDFISCRSLQSAKDSIPDPLRSSAKLLFLLSMPAPSKTHESFLYTAADVATCHLQTRAVCKNVASRCSYSDCQHVVPKVQITLAWGGDCGDSASKGALFRIVGIGSMISRQYAVAAKNKTIHFYRRPIAAFILAVAKCSCRWYHEMKCRKILKGTVA
jgi:hypothetical protein